MFETNVIAFFFRPLSSTTLGPVGGANDALSMAAPSLCTDRGGRRSIAASPRPAREATRRIPVILWRRGGACKRSDGRSDGGRLYAADKAAVRRPPYGSVAMTRS